MKYSKNRLIDNVYSLARARQIKIGEMETQAGVSPGYFSRLRQGEKNAAPGADFLLALAEALGVSVDTLLSFDLNEATEAETALHRYMEKLTRETDGRKISWREDPYGYLENPLMNPDGTTPHPLFETLPDDAGQESPLYYASIFRPGLKTLVPVATYGCVFPGGRTLYVVEVWNDGDDPASPGDWTEIELLMTGPGKYDRVPFCHTDHDHPSRLDEEMKRLLNAAKDSATHPYLTEEARELINVYLAEDTGTQEAKHETEGAHGTADDE